MPTLLVNIVAGSPANGCIGASHVLRHAFGQFGIRSHLQLVDLVIRDHASGDGIMYGTPEPSWDEAGQVFDGHCVLWLPGSQRIIDATVEQFPMVRQLGMGPVIGRVAVSTVDVDLEIPPPGTHLGVQRGDLMLLYTTVPADFADVVDVPWVRDRAEQDRRSGINLASTALDALREPRVRARAVAAPYPRLRALLRAVGDADSITDEDGDVQFTVLGPNGAQRLRLDEIPLPPNTPPDPTVAGQT